MRLVPFGLLVGSLILVPAAGLAQTPQSTHRIFVGVGFFGTSRSMGRSREFTSKSVIFGELATKQAGYPARSLANWFPVDVNVGVRLWRSLGVGATYSRLVYDEAARLDATIPHPTFLDASATGTASTGIGLARIENAIHLSFTGVVHSGDRVQVRLFAGPSFFWYAAEMVSDVQYDQTFDAAAPVNHVTVTGFTNERVQAQAMGFHAGADFAHALRARLDLVGTIRCSWGTVTLNREPLSALQQQMRVGGVQAFLGLRVRVGG